MQPVLELGAGVSFPTYLLIISGTFCIGLFWLIHRCKKMDAKITDGLDIAIAIMLGGFLGARLFHVFYEFPDYYQQHPDAIFKFWQGGFVFYGGAIGAFASAFAVIRLKKLDFHYWAEVFTPYFPVGYALGRMACFFNGCCYGAVCDLPWAVEFSQVEGLRHPTQLYAVGLELLLFGLILFFDKKRNWAWLKPTGQLFYVWVVGHSVNRLIMEFFRDDFRGSEVASLSVSTLISLVLFTLATSAFFYRTKRSVT